MGESKHCSSGCKRELPLEDFITNGEVRARCKACRERDSKSRKKRWRLGTLPTVAEQAEYRKALLLQPVAEGMKRCSTCLNVVSQEDFRRDDGAESTRCAACRKRNREWAQKSRAEWTDERRKKHSKVVSKRTQALKREVMNAYGGKCACCGEDRLEFLSVDHVNKDGAVDRRNGNWGGYFYRNIKKAGFPAHFRCLCFNCNFSLGVFHYCPHQTDPRHPIERIVQQFPAIQ